MEEIKQNKEINMLDLESLIEFRHEMHRNAENSFKEYKTQERILNYLKNTLKLKDSSIKISAKTGIIVTLQGQKKVLNSSEESRPLTIALRADIDGLPIKEKNHEKEYRSTGNSAHMCGHDGHTACLLGAISIISKKLEEIPENKVVKCFFQPAEENYIVDEETGEAISGAGIMVKEGCMDDVDEVYGFHNFPISGAKVKIIIGSKEVMAGVTEIKINVIILYYFF